VLTDYLHLWNALAGVELCPGISDSHSWRFATNGQYSAKLAYEGFFKGSIDFEPYERVWKTWAPAKCKFFLWLVSQNKCWTADRLARRGLDHPEKCLLCDQDEETIDHLLVSCVFARQFWFNLLQQVHIQQLAPHPDATSFMDWWRNAHERSTRLIQKGFSSLVVLGAWTLWKHRNRCVFDGAAPCMAAAMTQAEEERKVWELAGARGVSYLTAQSPSN
jgi:hypothetical protein